MGRVEATLQVTIAHQSIIIITTNNQTLVCLHTILIIKTINPLVAHILTTKNRSRRILTTTSTHTSHTSINHLVVGNIIIKTTVTWHQVMINIKIISSTINMIIHHPLTITTITTKVLTHIIIKVKAMTMVV